MRSCRTGAAHERENDDAFGRDRGGAAGRACCGWRRPRPTSRIIIRIGWVVAPADLVTLMFLKPELAPHAGKTYVPELIHFAGTPTAMTALAAGQIDCAALAYSTFALGVENAGMEDLRIIADAIQDGVPG